MAMTTLRVETQKIPASALGPENPLPDLSAAAPEPGAQAASGPDDPVQAYFRASHIKGCLPYRVQDGYDRGESERPFRMAVLENRHLRAAFLLELGGRLWSLVDKRSGRELLFQPRVLHFANVAIRNAWFSGGVEWNIAVRGHTAHTCSPLFAAETGTDGGSPALRLYEYDRFRGLLFQIDFLMPDNLPVLLARPRVINPNRETTPMYWWSNIAVGEAEGHRVLAPADSAFHFGYKDKMELLSVPLRDGVDASYPTRIRSAHDFFYNIPDGNRPWIASLDPAGRGLVHASTSRLKGRKMFVWGMGPGGRRWQEHLGGHGTAYIEIQAGLGRTQSEYLPMAPGADWQWLEAYMLMDADLRTVHGADWPAARRCVQDRLDSILPQAALESMLKDTRGLADRAPQRIIQQGAGWGALERRRRMADGEDAPLPQSMPFDDASLTEDQAPWLAILSRRGDRCPCSGGGEEGALPYRRPQDTPGAWLTGAAWRKRCLESTRSAGGNHWLAWLHAGVMAFQEGDLAAAADAWRQSLDREPSAWALRNLALLARHQGRTEEAASLYLKAGRLKPDLLELQVECGRTLVEAGRFTDLDRWLGTLPESVRRSGRIELFAARAALERNDPATAERILDQVQLVDIREGEIALTDLWFAIQERRIAAAEGVPIDAALKERVRRTLSPPARLDFRMH